jgi:RND family efflux transporter MFP subunit
MKPGRLSSLGLCVLIAATGCRRHPPAGSTANSPAPAPVRVITVSERPHQLTEDAAGTVRPRLSAVIAAKITGTIEAVLVSPGQQVKSGDLLVQLDAREIKARLDQAAAARDQAALDRARFQRLIKENAVSQQEFDAVESRFRSAAAAAKEAETMLDYTRITAPFSGVVTRKRADVGDLATPGRPLLDLENPAELRLEADIPEALVANVQLGARLAVTAGTPPLTVTGVVAEVAPAADALSRTFLVKLDLPAGAGLRSGQFARVAVPVGETRSLSVPRGAVRVNGQMESVFVVEADRARLRLVKTGKAHGAEVEIISGLTAGERVVTEGVAALEDGRPVILGP